MPRAIIGTKMIFDGFIGMRNGYPVKRRIARQLCGIKKQFEIHHIINNYRTLPASLCLPTTGYIPRLNNTGSRSKTCRKRFCSPDNDIFIRFISGQTQSVPKTTSNYKSYIVVICKVFYRIQSFCEFFSPRSPFFITCQFIQVPQTPREEPWRPTARIDISYFAINKRVRIKQFPRFLYKCRLQRILFCRKPYIFIDKFVLIFTLAYRYAEKQQ